MAILSAYMVPHPPLIIPSVENGRESTIQNTTDAYHEVGRRVAADRPETIVLFSPHQIMYTDYFHISPGRGAKGDFGQFGARGTKIEVSYDTEFTETLCRLAEDSFLPAGTLGEREKRLDHGTMVPLYFIRQYWKDFRLVRIGLSGLPLITHYELGQLVRETADALGSRTVLIASGDLSHRLKEDGPYGYQKEGPAYDRRIMDVMGSGAFGELLIFPEDFCEKAGECGHRAFTIMAGALDQTAVRSEQLSYEGPFGVGYGVCCFQTAGPDPERDFGIRYLKREKELLSRQRAGEDEYIRLARRTIENYVRTGRKIAVPHDLSEELLSRRAGVFVSIKEDHRLRGCIGTISAVQPSLAEEIIDNAISAASRDPRFSPVEAWELEKLTISVDVLGDAEQIDSPDQLDPARYGVIVTKGHKRGLLLPNLEGIDTAEEQIAIARKKAGIGKNEPVSLSRFEVIRHEVTPGSEILS